MKKELTLWNANEDSCMRTYSSLVWTSAGGSRLEVFPYSGKSLGHTVLLTRDQVQALVEELEEWLETQEPRDTPEPLVECSLT